MRSQHVVDDNKIGIDQFGKAQVFFDHRVKEVLHFQPSRIANAAVEPDMFRFVDRNIVEPFQVGPATEEAFRQSPTVG